MVPSLNESKCRSRINDKRISIARSGTFGDMKTWILQWTEELQHLEERRGELQLAANSQNGGKKPILMSVRVSIEPTSMLAVVSLVAASIHAREKGRSDLRDLSSSGLQRFTRGDHQ